MRMSWFVKICPLSQNGHHAVAEKSCDGTIQPCYVYVLMKSRAVNFNLNCYYYVFYFVIIFSFWKNAKFSRSKDHVTLTGCNAKHILMIQLVIMITLYCSSTEKLCKHKRPLGLIVFSCHSRFLQGHFRQVCSGTYLKNMFVFCFPFTRCILGETCCCPLYCDSVSSTGVFSFQLHFTSDR